MTGSGAIDRMQRSSVRLRGLAGLAVALAVLAPAAASAQIYGSWGYRVWNEPIEAYREPPLEYDRRPALRGEQPDFLTQPEIRNILAYEGFRLSGPPIRRNDVFVAQVLDGGGRKGRVVMDAFDGTILEHVATAVAPRPPQDIPTAPFEAEFERELSPDPRVIPGIGPPVREKASKPKVAVAREPKPVAPKAAPGKKLPSQSMKAPKSVQTPETKPAEVATPPRQTAVAPSVPLVATPELPAPVDVEAVRTPSREAPQNPAGLANGVPVNPLE